MPTIAGEPKAKAIYAFLLTAVLRAGGRLRLLSARRRKEERDALLEGALIAAGEVGWRAVTLEGLLARVGVSRWGFFANFRDLDDCFLEGYATEVERFADTVLGVGCGEPDLSEAVGGALERAAALIQRRPFFYRGLLVEVQAYGQPALTHRDEVLARFAAAVDRVGNLLEPDHTLPPITGRFLIATIEHVVVTALQEGAPERFVSTTPELTQLACIFYGES